MVDLKHFQTVSSVKDFKSFVKAEASTYIYDRDKITNVQLADKWMIGSSQVSTSCVEGSQWQLVKVGWNGVEELSFCWWSNYDSQHIAYISILYTS